VTRRSFKQWIQGTGANFDFIIDDGGHTNHQIWTSFVHLFFHALNPGGVNFVEDLHVGRYEGWHSNGLPHGNSSVMMDLLTDWLINCQLNAGLTLGPKLSLSVPSFAFFYASHVVKINLLYQKETTHA